MKRPKRMNVNGNSQESSVSLSCQSNSFPGFFEVLNLDESYEPNNSSDCKDLM